MEFWEFLISEVFEGMPFYGFALSVGAMIVIFVMTVVAGVRLRKGKLNGDFGKRK